MKDKDMIAWKEEVKHCPKCKRKVVVLLKTCDDGLPIDNVNTWVELK